MAEKKIKDIRLIIDGKEFRYVGRELAEYRNVTVAVLKNDDGSISWGWRQQDNTEFKFFTEDENENNNQSET